MGRDEHSLGLGGPLKLKGAKDYRVEKKKKKKRDKQAKPEGVGSAIEKDLVHAESPSADGDPNASNNVNKSDDSLGVPDAPETEPGPSDADYTTRGKTEAEIRHEEMRRKRLQDRIKREGVKTHKERVEELNKYLSNLSEHHDMPRIGPG